MTSHFIAKPPSPVKWNAIPQYLRRMGQSVAYIIWQIVVPFKSRPDEIEPLPEPDPSITVSESHVKQCQWIFDQAESRRVNLEQKAQSTFSLMVFLVPLLASIFVFILSRGTTSRTLFLTSVLAVISASFLLLGFISAVRAVAVKGGETLFLNSVIDESGQFRKYSESFHARGLLYCASMNTAMNDHIAQFVKGAHILTAAAVVVLLVAAIPASIALSTAPTSPVQTQIVGPVTFSSPELISLSGDVAAMKKEIEKLSSAKATEGELKLLEQKIQKLDEKLGRIQRVAPANPSKNGKTP